MIRIMTRAVSFMGVSYLLHRQLVDQPIQTVAHKKLLELESLKKAPNLDSSRVLTHPELALITKFSAFKHQAHALHREVELAAALSDSSQKQAALFALIDEISNLKNNCRTATDTFHKEALKRPVIKEVCKADEVLGEIEALYQRAIRYL